MNKKCVFLGTKKTWLLFTDKENKKKKSQDITFVTFPSAGHRCRGPARFPSSKQFASGSRQDPERGQLQLA